MTPYPQTDLRDLFGLLARYGGAFRRSPFRVDKGRVAADWAEAIRRRHGSDNVVLNLFVKRVLLVNGPELSAHILADAPSEEGFVEGGLKRDAMAFLAPNALTIDHGEQWRRLRPLNEAVLLGQEWAGLRETVEAAFPQAASGNDDVRRGMGETMRRVVFGDGPSPPTAPEDAQTLFGYVENPLKRVLLGWTQRGRRARLYAGLAAADSGLAGQAKRACPEGTTSEEILQQMPHWMFTFTGSGTHWVVTTLALVGSRGEAEVARVLAEREYARACLHEAARLYPPVTKTFHRCPRGAHFEGRDIAPDGEIAHYFPFMNRSGDDPDLQAFRPQRWLDDPEGSRARFPNTFLSGARVCPGRELIGIVAEYALTALLRRGTRASHPSLATDPVPFTFPLDRIDYGRHSR